MLAVGGGWGAPLERLKPYLLTGDANGLRFSIANALKDLTYYNAMADDSHSDHTIAKAVKNTLDQATHEGDPNDFLSLLVPRLVGRKPA